MKVHLIRPPHHNLRLSSHLRNEPLSLETVAAALDDCDITLLDMQFDKTPLRDVLSRDQPDLVGISGYTADVRNIRRILSEIKKVSPKTFTVVGGHHATIVPEDFNRPGVDAIVVGMGEVTFRELVETLTLGRDIREIDGLAIPSETGLSFTKPRAFPKSLDSLPYPRRDLSKKHQKKFKVMGKPIGLVNTAKGCPFRCTFCSIINEMKGKYIVKSPERVVRELQRVPQKLVRFADGNTFGSIKRMDRLQRLLRGSGLNKEFIFDVRADTISKNEKLIAKWREVGLRYVAVGLESVNEARLAALGKGSSVDDNIRALKILHDNDIKIIGQFMIDCDFTEPDFDSLVDFVHTHRIHFPSFLITTPFPGTPLYDTEKDRLLIDDYEQFDCFHPLLPTTLERSDFLSHYVNLYDRTYSFARVVAEIKNRVFRGKAARDLPLSLLVLIRLHLLMRKRMIRKEYRLS